MNGYKMRNTSAGASLTVPPDIARLIPEDMRFDCEVSEEGLLFRARRATPPEGLPEWLDSGGGERALGSPETRARREP